MSILSGVFGGSKQTMRYQDLLDETALKKYASAMNTRAGSMGIPGKITSEMLRDRILESGGCCEWCGCKRVDDDFEIDHILSLSRGGTNDSGNLALTCPDCNRRKAEKHPATFALETVARTGQKTPLITRVLAGHNVEAAPQQQSLFGDDLPQSTASNLDLEDSDSPPPYRW